MNLALAWPVLTLMGACAAVFVAGGIAGTWRRGRPQAIEGGTGVLRQDSFAMPADQDGTVEAIVRDVLNAEHPLAEERAVALEMACESGLFAGLADDTLSRVLSAVVRDAIERAASGRILVTASRHGGRVRVAVTDDAPVWPQDMQQMRLRDPERLISLVGGTLEVQPRPGLGTTVVMRFAERVERAAASGMTDRRPEPATSPQTRVATALLDH